MLQLIYVSSVAPGVDADAAQILHVSRTNNRRDGVTGLLYSDGGRFLQVLEGPAPAVEAAFTRISADRRHRAVVVLSRREIEARAFGDWDMAHRTPGADADDFVGRINDIVADAPPYLRGTFEGFAETRRRAA